MTSVQRIVSVAAGELSEAVRSRRAVMTVIVFLAASALMMYGVTALVSLLEVEVARTLQLEPGSGTGSVANTLWKSVPFRRIVKGALKDPLLFEAVQHRHPLELLYAFFVFAYVPILAVLTAGGRLSEELESGAVRFQLLRVRRHEWVLGRWLGQCLLQLPALFMGALVAYVFLAWRMPQGDVLRLFPALCMWSFRAWFLLVSWLGLAMGVSMLTHSQTKASSWGFLLVVIFTILPRRMYVWAALGGVRGWLVHFADFFPVALTPGLWEPSWACCSAAALRLVLQSLFYLSIGYFFCSRRDVR